MNQKDQPQQRYREFIGVDVSKAQLDAHLLNSNRAFNLGNDVGSPDKVLADQLKTLRKSLVVVEATGGYERIFVDWCHQHAIPVSLQRRSLRRW